MSAEEEEDPDETDSDGNQSKSDSEKRVLDAVEAVKARHCLLHQPPRDDCDSCIRGKTTQKRHISKLGRR